MSFDSSKPPSIHANHSTINNDPQRTQKQTTKHKKNFHCNSSLMLGMMDGKLGIKNVKFVGLRWFLKLGDDGDGLGRDVIEDLSG